MFFYLHGQHHLLQFFDEFFLVDKSIVYDFWILWAQSDLIWLHFPSAYTETRSKTSAIAMVLTTTQNYVHLREDVGYRNALKHERTKDYGE